MYILALLLLIAVPRYIVIDSRGIGTEFLENQGAKVISRLDSLTYLVEGYLDKMDHTPYEIALYQEPGKVSPGVYKKGKYFIPPLDNEISYYFALVNVDSIFQVIQTLQDFSTRYAYTPSCRSAENYLRNRLAYYTDNCVLWPLSWNSTYMYNVVGERFGAKQDFLIISSHLDSYSNDPWNFAPGADDNASGCAVVVECARVLTQVQNPFVSFKFIPFTAEEIGLIGSSSYANYVASENLPLLGIVNSDMVGFNPPDGYDFDINLDTLSILGQVTKFVVQNYILGNNRWSYTPFSGSDHYPFAQRGYPWVFLIESNYQLNPNYHRTSDLISTLDPVQMVNATKLVLGVALYFALLPLPPESLVAVSYGDGNRVFLSWPRVGYAGETYVVYRGLNVDNLTPVSEVSDTFYMVDGQTEGYVYYYMVRSKANNRLGFGTPIKGVYVNSVPLSPHMAKIEPLFESLKVYWHPNSELDISGYNIYCSVDGSNFVKVNTNLVTDTFYVDASASGPIWYYYYVTAVDVDGFESAPSETLRARPVTLSEGVLVLDEFRNGPGTSPISPDQTMQEAFVDTVLRGAGFGNYTVLDVSNYSSLTLSDLGIYGVIWVMSDDNTERLGARYKDALQRYITLGGKVIIEGYQNLLNLGLVNGYPSAVNPNNAYGMSIDSVYLNTSIDFVRGYSDVYGLEIRPEPTKVLSSWGGRLQNIEAYKVNSGDVILLFDSYSDSAVFEGRACGVIFGGSVVLLGFPLYYMRTQDVVGLMNFIKSRGIGVRDVVKGDKRSYYLINSRYLSINGVASGMYEIYDIGGRLTKSGEFRNGRIDLGNLPRGIYYVQVKTSDTLRDMKVMKVR